MLSFGEIRRKYDIDQIFFFKFLQLRNDIRASQSNLLSKPSTSDLEKLLSKDSLSEGAISELYNYLLSNSIENAGTDISLEVWHLVCTKAHTQSINTQFRLLQYKWLMRTYITPVPLNKYNRKMH